MLLWTSRSVGAQRKTYFGLKVSVPNPNSLCARTLLLVHRRVVFEIFYLFFHLHIFTDKKSLGVIILPIIMVLKFFLLSCFLLVFLPTTLTSLPPGVMLLNHSIAPRDSATDIEKTSQKGAPEREQPNRSVVVNRLYLLFSKIIVLYQNNFASYWLPSRKK